MTSTIENQITSARLLQESRLLVHLYIVFVKGEETMSKIRLLLATLPESGEIQSELMETRRRFIQKETTLAELLEYVVTENAKANQFGRLLLVRNLYRGEGTFFPVHQTNLEAITVNDLVLADRSCAYKNCRELVIVFESSENEDIDSD